MKPYTLTCVLKMPRLVLAPGSCFAVRIKDHTIFSFESFDLIVTRFIISTTASVDLIVGSSTNLGLYWDITYCTASLWFLENEYTKQLSFLSMQCFVVALLAPKQVFRRVMFEASLLFKYQQNYTRYILSHNLHTSNFLYVNQPISKCSWLFHEPWLKIDPEFLHSTRIICSWVRFLYIWTWTSDHVVKHLSWLDIFLLCLFKAIIKRPLYIHILSSLSTSI